jgi:hypothetical protein
MRDYLRVLMLGMLLVLVACETGGDDGDDGDDAPFVDAPAGDGPPGGPDASTVQCGLYEMCNDVAGGTDCESGICRVFNMLGANGCTQACDVNNPCPNDAMGAVQCNMQGQCRPNVLTACTP